MPWRFRLFRRRPLPPPDVDEAREHLARIDAQQGEVDRLTQQLDKRRAGNHFREAFEQALRGNV